MPTPHLTAAVAAGALAIAGSWSVAPAIAQEASSTAETTAESTTDTPAEVQIEPITMGDADAPVKLIEYASFTCPHCATFHQTVLPQLKENYIDTGDVEYEYREVYFDRLGLWASMVSRCGGDDSRYFEIADMLYDQQRQWTQGEPATVAGNLRTLGANAGIAPDELEACFGDGAMAEALVANFEQNAEADGIRSTPSFVIDGETYSNMSYDELSSILDERLADAEG